MSLVVESQSPNYWSAWEVRRATTWSSVREQLLDNTSYMMDQRPLSGEEQELIRRAVGFINGSIAIPCTGCAYCTENCPMNIPIPQYFALYNEYARAPREVWKMEHLYQNLARTHGRASECVKCGQCEQSCPQKIQITDWMEKVAVAFGEEVEKAYKRVRSTPGVRKKD